jgi:cell division protein FtsB
MNNLINSISEKRFYFIILLIILYIIFNFFGGDRGLIEYFKKKSLLKEFQEKNLEIKKEIIFFTRKNDFLSVNINKDYLDEIYRDFFVLGKKSEKIYIINQK